MVLEALSVPHCSTSTLVVVVVVGHHNKLLSAAVVVAVVRVLSCTAVVDYCGGERPG